MLVTGANGSGKTNLLEAIHVGTQGFSPRTRSDAQLIRSGATAGRVALAGDRAGVPTSIELGLSLQEPKRARLNGATLRSAEQLRSEIATLVFTPDRLAVVKGGPAARRAYLDRSLARLYPARSQLPVEYAAAVGQRNAALRRVAAGASSHEALEPWTKQVAELGALLVAARRDTIDLLRPRFAERGEELGLASATLAYAAEPPTVAALEGRLARDLERGTTGLGPHLDDIGVRAGDRDLRVFGSQESSGWPCSRSCSPRPSCSHRGPAAAAAAPRRRALRARRCAQAHSQRADRPHRPGDRDGDGGRGAPACPRPAAHRDPGEGDARLMDRLGGEVRQALRGVGVPDAGVLAEITRVWPAAVGDAISRAAWPLRLSRDNTLHVATLSSAWAFELTALAAEILEKLRTSLTGPPPSALRFAPGPLPAPAAELPPATPTPRPLAGPLELQLADELTSALGDDELRRTVARAAAASLARGLEEGPAGRRF